MGVLVTSANDRGTGVVKQDEKRLVAKIKAGLPQARAELIHTQYECIYRFLVHLTGAVHDAEDLTQETFTAAWQKIFQFEGRSSIGTWLHRIAYGKFVDSRRTSKRQATLVDRYADQDAPGSNRDPHEIAAAVDEARHLHDALRLLNEAHRVLLVLHYLQGQSYQEMAEILKEPLGTIKWRTREALVQLRSVLTKEAKHERSPTAR